MSYRKISFPVGIFQKFMKTSNKLGYQKRGSRWKLLDLLLVYAEAHPDLFRSR